MVKRQQYKNTFYLFELQAGLKFLLKYRFYSNNVWNSAAGILNLKKNVLYCVLLFYVFVLHIVMKSSRAVVWTKCWYK